MSGFSALSIRGLTKAFGNQPVLVALDLDVSEGSLMAVLGRSGCGKTTLLRVVAGFEYADSGGIRVGDNDVSIEGRHWPPERRGVGVVAQEGTLFPHLDVAANIAFGLRRSQRQAGRVQQLLSLVGLAGLERRFPHELSGGEQQRVALARALAPAPRIILLDEPFSALDPSLRASLRAEVCAALRASGTTALLVTHDQVEALSIADQVAVMRDGRLVQTTDPATLYRKPVDADVARFVGDAVFLPGQLADGHIHCLLGRLPVYDRPAGSGPATVMIRPEQLVLNPDSAAVTATVLAISYHGHDATVRLKPSTCNDESSGLLARVPGFALPLIGDTVTIAVRGEVVAFAGSPDGHAWSDRAFTTGEAIGPMRAGSVQCG
jgi:iron(III) transport system ATP-binding protein